MTGLYAYLVGMDVPQGSPEEAAEFNDFYSNVHLPEVVSRNPGFISGTRYQLTEASLGGPRYVALYEVADEASALAHIEQIRRPGNSGRYSSGPELWRSRQITWTRMYTRLGDTYRKP
jgi:hypothetical protein